MLKKCDQSTTSLDAFPPPTENNNAAVIRPISTKNSRRGAPTQLIVLCSL